MNTLFERLAAPRDEPQFIVMHIGPTTLYCGDAYAIRPQLGWFDVDCMDPPYRFNSSGGGKWRNARGASDQIGEEKLDRGFDMSIINATRCGSVIVFCHNDQLYELLGHLRDRFRRVALLHWIKSNPAPHRNKHYLADKEDYFHAWNPGYHPVGDHHDMHRWHEAPVSPSKIYGHPTVKPLPLMDKIMRNVAGESVCDPFMGTGSTGVAAVRAGKRFTGIEANPKHFATAVARITEAVGTI